MPHIAVTMYPGRDKSAKLELAQQLMETMNRVLSVPEEVISVSVQDIAPEHWAESMEKLPKETILIAGGKTVQEG